MVQFSSGYIIVVSLVILCLAPTENESVQFKNANHDEQGRAKYIKFLNAIADVNEQRLNALKIYTELDKYFKVASRLLRHTEDTMKTPIVVLLNNNPEANDEIYDKGHNTPLIHKIRQLTKEHHKNNVEHREAIIKNELNELGMGKIFDIIKSEVESKGEVKFFTGFGAIPDNEDLLRGGCYKKQVKKCTKACKATYRDVCENYKCSKSMRKSFKRKCKSNCKDKFND